MAKYVAKKIKKARPIKVAHPKLKRMALPKVKVKPVKVKKASGGHPKVKSFKFKSSGKIRI